MDSLRAIANTVSSASRHDDVFGDGEICSDSIHVGLGGVWIRAVIVVGCEFDLDAPRCSRVCDYCECSDRCGLDCCFFPNVVRDSVRLDIEMTKLPPNTALEPTPTALEFMDGSCGINKLDKRRLQC